MALPPQKLVALSKRCMDPPRPRLQPSTLPNISAMIVCAGTPLSSAWPCSRYVANTGVVIGEMVHDAGSYGLFADVEVQEAADLLLLVQLGARLLEPADPDHLPQQMESSLLGEFPHGVTSSAVIRLARLECRGVALGQSQLPRLEQPSHDLAAPRLRQVVLELDLTGSNRRPQLLAGKADELLGQFLAWLNARIERDEGLDDLPCHRVRFADDPGLGHRRVFDQGALDLERADEMAGGLDDIVGPADEPEVPVLVDLGQVARQIPAADKCFPIALLVVQVGPEHGRPAGA